MRKKILFVSVAFPPKSDAEALQVAKYYYYLQKHKDLQIDVVTSSIPTLYMPVDPDLENYAVGINQLISLRLRENRYLNFIRYRLGLRGTVFPDSKFSFHQQYKGVLAQLKEKPDLIYSRAFPNSSTIMAYKLKQELKVPWILHLSDPWADCPMHRFSGKVYKKNDEWERKCFETADVISLTSKPAIDFYKTKYPALEAKFRFYPNVYDRVKGEDKDTVEFNLNNRKFRVVYTGGIIEANGPGYFLKPLSELFQMNSGIADKLEVIFAGTADASSRALFKKYNLPFVKWIGKIPLKEALKLQRSADYLLAIDNPVDDPKLAMFFLSKILDYMVARKRILILTSKGSASDQVVADIKADSCHHNDTTAIKNALMRALNAFEKGDENYLVNDAPPEKYDAAYNSNRLHNEIVKLLNDKDEVFL